MVHVLWYGMSFLCILEIGRVTYLMVYAVLCECRKRIATAKQKDSEVHVARESA